MDSKSTRKSDAPAAKPQKSSFGQLFDAVRAICSKHAVDWTDELQRDLPKRWEKHGDLVILPQNCFQCRQWRLLGSDLWRTVAECMQASRVGRKRSVDDDVYSTPLIDMKYGRDGWVEHKDGNIIYQYDVTKLMFKIGNVAEKTRVAQFDCRHETVVDLFAGIGYYTLPLLLNANAAHVCAIDWNSDAVEALQRTLKCNNVDNRCTVIEGDARKVAPAGSADRVLLALMPTARPHLRTGCICLKRTGGRLHVHELITHAGHEVYREPIVIERLPRKASTPPPANTVNVDVQDVMTNIVNMVVSGGDENSMKHQHRERCDSGVSTQHEGDKEASETSFTDGTDTDPTVEPQRRAHKKISRAATILSEFSSRRFPSPIIAAELLNGDWSKLNANHRRFAIECAQSVTQYMTNLYEIEVSQTYTTTIEKIAKVKNYGPYVEHVVLDLFCQLKSNCDVDFETTATGFY